ncbi:hypothetical protein A9Q99_04560 [Gammaproteobacteria bacterium 45_16_T64]|nr:hypothetical protein A9Q99_04560 [Gammaproteobacteria bacterium 45_16_T64]
MSKINQYRVFVSIVENGSFSSAAKELLVSPSSISKKLSLLEETLKVKLINRSTHSISVTSQGETFYRKVKDILDRIETAEAVIKDNNTSPRGKLTISLPPILLRTPLMTLLKDFTERYPDIHFHLIVSDHYIDLIEKNVDFAFRLGELDDSRLTAVTLEKLKLSYYASPAYLSLHDDIQFSALFKKNHIIMPSSMSNSGLTKLIGLTGQKNMSDAYEYHSTNDTNSLIEMAVASMGVVMAPDITVKSNVTNGTLQSIFPKRRLPKLPVNLIFHNNEFLAENMSIFKEYIKGNFADAMK